jgi:hypothetical protein
MGKSFLSLPLFNMMNSTCQSPVITDIITLQVKPEVAATHPASCYLSLQADLLHA